LKYCLAIDIGASGGRHIVGYEENGSVTTDEVYRFPNGCESCDGHLIWNIDLLFEEVVKGIVKAFEKYSKVESLSIDTWGVDYVLMRGDEVIKPVYAYRDSRTEEVIDEVHSIVGFDELYSRTGSQFQRFNTIYQLFACKKSGRLSDVTDFLMIPEFLMYKLTGVKKKEFTNATTTGLINAESLEYDREIISRLGLPEHLFGKLSKPGEVVGRLLPEVAERVGGNLKVVLCATHDTASAVEAIQMQENAPYISSGTWSLLGIRTEKPICDAVSMSANWSNEGGVGYNRYQKNITGMWLVQCLRKELCPEMSYDEIAKLARTSTYTQIFDVNDEVFTAPESMKRAIDDYFKAQNKPLPSSDADYFNSAYVSLAASYREAVTELERNTGLASDEIYIVGGGAKNSYLNELTEASTGKRVVALPIEATAIGNLRVQLKL